MGAADVKTGEFFRRLDEDSAIRAGEQFVCVIRLVIIPVFTVFATYYRLRSPSPTGVLFPAFIVAAIASAAMSAIILWTIRAGRFSRWMAYASAVSDLALSGLVVFTSANSYPLHFPTSVASIFLFVVIAMSAVRRIPALVVLTGLGAALVHLIFAGHFYSIHAPAGSLYVSIEEGSPPVLGLNFLDSLSRSVCMAAMSWLIAYVTKSLRDSRRHYQALFDHIPDGIVITSPDDRVVNVNERFADMLGANASSLIGLRSASLFAQSSADSDSVAAVSARLIGKPAVLRRKDGREIPIRTASSPMLLEGGVHTIISVRDVSEQLLVEKQLSRSQEMEAFGKMAGGLAHDTNNILGGILGAASLTMRMSQKLAFPIADKLRRNMEMVAECGEKAREVIGKLLAFSRGATLQPRLIDLNEVLADVASICTNTFGPEYRIATTGSGAPAMVLADGQALAQALLNLCINSRDAMPRGGDIRVKLDSCRPDVNLLALNPGARRHEEYWRLAVGDNGPGIQARHMSSLFDPFFTTKPPEKGSGLGLAMVHSIAIRHRGLVDVESSPGKGAVFRIYLPKTHDAVTDVPASTTAKVASP